MVLKILVVKIQKLFVKKILMLKIFVLQNIRVKNNPIHQNGFSSQVVATILTILTQNVFANDFLAKI